MSKEVELLNRRLAAELGARDGQPWFSWQWAPDCQYFERPPGHEHQNYTRRNWADRIGKVWVLTQWGPPPMSREEWARTFRGQFRYPERGRYIVHGETALLPGMVPDGELTQFYIRRITEQKSKTYARTLAEINAGLEEQDLASQKEYFDMADDWFPAYWSSKGGAHVPGTRGGHVSFGSSQ